MSNDDPREMFDPEYDGNVGQNGSRSLKWFALGLIFYALIILFVLSPLITLWLFGFETAIAVGFSAYLALVAINSIS